MNAKALFVAFIGCGKMGGALLQAAHRRTPHRFMVVNPSRPPDLPGDRISYAPDILSAAADLNRADVIILAVKPQILPDICKEAARHINPGALIISLAAGKTLADLETLLPAGRPVIRAMPNLPATIGRGITVCCANAHATPAHVQIATDLFNAAGQAEWMKDDRLFDAVTALSGSGPAYVFHLIEILEKAGKTLGLPADLSMRLARQTVTGSAALCDAQPEISAAVLRERVTSPGGTTAAALDILMDGRLADLYEAALKAARDRGRIL